MYKLITKNETVVKSYSISDLWKFIMTNRTWDYKFFINYTPITEDDFLKTYLKITGDYNSYLFIYRVLKPQKTIYQWATRTKI